MGINKAYKPAVFLCTNCGWILGLVRRNSNHVRHLDIYKIAVNIDIADPDFQIMNMTGGDVVCSHCGAVRSWSSAGYSFDELLRRRSKRTFGLEVEKT